MFLGAIPRRPDKATTYKELRRHLLVMGAWVAAIRAAPYVLHYLSSESNPNYNFELLKLEL